jgi:hypothetical protein
MLVDSDLAHFAYPCERSQATRRVPASHSSTSALLFNPLMYWVSVPGHSATICQSSSAIRSILKVTQGDFFYALYVTVWHLLPCPTLIDGGTPSRAPNKRPTKADFAVSGYSLPTGVSSNRPAAPFVLVNWQEIAETTTSSRANTSSSSEKCEGKRTLCDDAIELMS